MAIKLLKTDGDAIRVRIKQLEDAGEAWIEEAGQAGAEGEKDAERSCMRVANVFIRAGNELTNILREAEGQPLLRPSFRDEEILTIDYVNHKGDRAMRRIVPSRAWYGSDEWHPETQWRLDAFDVDKGEWRSFALAGIMAMEGCC